ncbi:uncharacterized protein PV07_09933 [Cladophialophora immunda]|uniref:Uncharacterized protein n=1 Tax=Cladophialophora immunda TaxID=569365 RepID=A0A0D2C147_9EURO|nr:uncharacterized protein PV07_09933 [Cladophialophora immunda]KIW24205.1 hypothetical protein PV07_09933 [Cladophialophora immunda]
MMETWPARPARPHPLTPRRAARSRGRTEPCLGALGYSRGSKSTGVLLHCFATFGAVDHERSSSLLTTFAKSKNQKLGIKDDDTQHARCGTAATSSWEVLLLSFIVRMHACCAHLRAANHPPPPQYGTLYQAFAGLGYCNRRPLVS